MYLMFNQYKMTINTDEKDLYFRKHEYLERE